jgi:hypothetical protein
MQTLGVTLHIPLANIVQKVSPMLQNHPVNLGKKNIHEYNIHGLLAKEEMEMKSIRSCKI